MPQIPPAKGKQVGLSLGRHFFAMCKKNNSGSTASSGAAASAGATPQQPTEADATEDLINLSFNKARHLSASLLHDRWQNYGPGMFVHGASGILVQIKDRASGRGVDLASILTHASQLLKQTGYNLLDNVRDLCLHIKVDGVDADGNHQITEWARKQIEQIITASLLPGESPPNRFAVGPKITEFAFGPKLITFAEQVRDAGEAKYVSDDGRVDRPTASPPRKTKREHGYAAFKETLLGGGSVAWRSNGNSLARIGIKSGYCCKYGPVSSHDDVNEGDVVFCQIKRRYWQHMVKTRTRVGAPHLWLYTISNAAGHENGTITLEHIYGVLIDFWR